MKYLCLIVGLLTSMLVASCENDLRDVEKVSSKKQDVPVDKSYGVTIIYSDSAKVKGKLLTPELLQFHTANPYYEFPKGITIIFFDENLNESSRVVSDYAVRREHEKQVELRKNVVVTNVKGDVFKSEELIWDEVKQQFFSNQLVNIIKPDGTNIFGSGFRSDQNFDKPIIERAYGNLATGNQLGF
ncbi:LPS export ABC transporter periplasmic protein LptC [Desertivirga xinjiangensis]|uniref:LPS export ABC transporter periplasmic protein LptC n=1 Tax=Desertivirga xinjiangensis TaxID=539206 RepID=UPI00210A7A53|nr:LPS export ABC transporter periplasmic protein LptC [Pedobacter xinjiangensis]